MYYEEGGYGGFFLVFNKTFKEHLDNYNMFIDIIDTKTNILYPKISTYKAIGDAYQVENMFCLNKYFYEEHYGQFKRAHDCGICFTDDFDDEELYKPTDRFVIDRIYSLYHPDYVLFSETAEVEEYDFSGDMCKISKIKRKI